MIRVAHVIPSLEVGGAEMWLTRLVAATEGRTWHAGVISLSDQDSLSNRIRRHGATVKTLAMRSRVPGVITTWRLGRELRALAPDLIQGWMYHGNLAASVGRLMIRGRPPVIWNVRGDVYSFARDNRFTAWVVRLGALISSRIERIVYNSRSSARHHTEIGFAEAGAVVIPNGFDTEALKAAPAARAALRRRLGVADDTLVIGRVARYHPMKDFSTFLAAAGQLARTGIDAHYVLAGRDVSAQNAILGATIERLGIAGVVHLLGEVEDAPALIAGLDIMCSSSAYGEGFPNVLAEALSCEVPCVTTDVGDSAWVVGEAGEITPPTDPGALAAGLRRMIEIGPEGRRRLGALGRARIVQEFSVQRVSSMYEGLYREVLGKGRLS